MKNEIITKKSFPKVKKRVEELLVRCWKMSKPIYPKMLLDFKVNPQESYFSQPGKVWFLSPLWRGDDFVVSILFHEGHHWNIYPVDLLRSLKEVFDARNLLAEEIGFKPTIIHRGLWKTEEDWSGFGHPVEEFQYVENILGDYLINLLIHDNYTTVWDALWNFLSLEGQFVVAGKVVKRDTTFLLYIAVYSELVIGLKSPILMSQESIAKVPKIAKIVKECRSGRISTTFAVKELVKLFHSNIMEDAKEQKKEGDGEGKGKQECPVCKNDEFEITEYQKEDGSWVKI